MATSPHLSLKLRTALGNEAGEELIRIVDKAASDISDLRGDIAELRHQTELGFARVDTKFAEFDTRFAKFDTKFAELDMRIEKQTNKLILWSFAFWVTTLASLATLMLKLR
jgi:hypothetical protein